MQRAPVSRTRAIEHDAHPNAARPSRIRALRASVALAIGVGGIGLAAAGAVAFGFRAIPPVAASTARVLSSKPYECRPDTAPCQRVANAFIRADVNPFGGFSLGTTGGDPGTTLDDDLGLLYGFVPGGASNTGSGYITVRIIGPNGIDDFAAQDAVDLVSQVEDATSVRTVWNRRTTHRVVITQTLSAVHNPYSGRPDLLDMRWQVTNRDSVDLSIGLRSLLDIQIGANDGAPYFVPGVGTLTFEQQFSGAQVPPFWIAFQAADFDPSFLRGLGLVRDAGVTAPDDLIVANWRKIQEQPFDYTVDATRVITGDSAVALLWRPRSVRPGQSFEINTRYGIAANRGGRAFVAAPVLVDCGTSFEAALFLSNFDLAPLNSGRATITLPAGITLAPGETAEKSLGSIAPADTGSVVWQLQVAPGTVGPRQIRTVSVFDGGRTFETSADLTVQCIAPPPTATSAPTSTPAPTTTPLAIDPGVCDWVYGRVPRVVIEAALANPDRVYGWNKPQNPNAPVSPVNPLRRRLTLSNRGVPYHPMSNPVVFKAGCQ